MIIFTHRGISDLNYSFKKIQFIPAAKNNHKDIKKRHEYAIKFLALKKSKIIFLDKMVVNCIIRIKYGISLQGTYPRKTVTFIRS